MRGRQLPNKNKLLKGWYFKMTKTTKKCNDNCNCAHVDAKVCSEKTTLDYGFYSNVLKKPFERLDDLKKAEEVYYAEQKAKEDKASQKKADAKRVEDAFKALNAARKLYKEDLGQLTKEYAEALDELKKAFDLGKKDIHDALVAAEDNYSKALKTFTDKYPEGYHLTLKDGDFETTISGSSKTSKSTDDYTDIFRVLFGL
jgi:hypothetical protein